MNKWQSIVCQDRLMMSAMTVLCTGEANIQEYPFHSIHGKTKDSTEIKLKGTPEQSPSADHHNMAPGISCDNCFGSDIGHVATDGVHSATCSQTELQGMTDYSFIFCLKR